MTTPPDEVYILARKATQKRYYDKHREKTILGVIKWRKENPEKCTVNSRKSHLKLKYGMTVEEFDSLFQKQNGKCAICLRSHIPGKRPWHIDHDHKTGKIRGILCKHCNVMLGMSQENTEVLNSAISYVRTTRP
jgi:hypothetical protein